LANLTNPQILTKGRIKILENLYRATSAGQHILILHRQTTPARFVMQTANPLMLNTRIAGRSFFAM
jgi:hypothetical protein